MRRERTALIAIGGIAMACAMTARLTAMSAQMELKTTEVKNFEVVSVHGNIVVAKTDAGAKEYTVTDDFRFTIDGKKIGVHDLKPGMKGTATVTTTTTVTPMYLTEVKKGEVTKVFGELRGGPHRQRVQALHGRGRQEPGLHGHEERAAGRLLATQGR